MSQRQIEGINPVREALKAGRSVHRLLVARSEAAQLKDIMAKAEKRSVIVVTTSQSHLDQLSTTGRHQGVIAVASPVSYVGIDTIQKGEKSSLVVALDGVEDPQNLGSILRVSDCAGVDAVIIPKRRAVGLSPGVLRASAGAAEHVKVVQVTNLVRALGQLRDKGYWIVGADATGDQMLYDVDLNRPLVVVMGGEDKGLGRLIQKNCDMFVKIPDLGHVGSLNVATATSVVLFEARRQQLYVT